MKKLYALLSVVLMAFTASAVNVTFKVNMANETVSANGVHVAGNFDANGSSGTAWSPSAYTMTDANNDGVYEVTIDLNVGMYEFKFINDNDWPGAENVPAGAQVGGGSGNNNRWAYVAAAQDVGPICFAELVDCGKVGVSFAVNMAAVTVNAAGVHIAGDLQGWDPASTEMHNPDGATIYRYIHEFNSMDNVQFKFVNGDDWSAAESVPSACETGGNRFINNITSDTLMTSVCYGACTECALSDVTFRVNMANESVSPDGVWLAGNFTNWAGGQLAMTDVGGDIYEVVATLSAGSYEYKFRNGCEWEGVSSNRTFNVSSDTTYEWCFGDTTVGCPTVTYPAESDITFTVLIPDSFSLSTDPDSGGVWIVSKTLTCWQDNPLQLQVDATNPRLFSLTLTRSGAPEVLYKFGINKPNTTGYIEETAPFDTLGCGAKNGGFTDNRLLMRTASDTIVSYCFNKCSSDCAANSVAELPFNSEVKVYPNPFTDITTVSFSNAGTYNLVVIDLTGKVVLTTVNAGASQVNLDLGALNNGMYILKIVDANGATTTKKLMLQ